VIELAREPLLRIHGLSKNYGALAAISDLSFDVLRGQNLGITGPNGAGKTTLFDLISGVTRPTRGSIVFLGREVSGQSPQAMCNAGLVRTFQLNAVFDTMTVRENVVSSCYFGAKRRLAAGAFFDRATLTFADEVIEILGLTGLRSTRADQLSVLERKLLMLASAAACGPKLLLLDEPVGGLNTREIETCTRALKTLQGKLNVTFVIIEHVMSFLMEMSDQVLVLHHGMKLHEGAPESMRDNAQVLEVYLGGAPSAKLAIPSPIATVQGA
jgi:branched-chain amino acid transport system ATP-binding protein